MFHCICCICNHVNHSASKKLGVAIRIDSMQKKHQTSSKTGQGILFLVFDPSPEDEADQQRSKCISFHSRTCLVWDTSLALCCCCLYLCWSVKAIRAFSCWEKLHHLWHRLLPGYFLDHFTHNVPNNGKNQVDVAYLIGKFANLQFIGLTDNTLYQND